MPSPLRQDGKPFICEFPSLIQTKNTGLSVFESHVVLLQPLFRFLSSHNTLPSSAESFRLTAQDAPYFSVSVISLIEA